MSDITPFEGFPKAGLSFLSGLAENNNKAWFDAHRDDYDQGLMLPARAFVVAMGERLREGYSPDVRSEPKVNKAIRRMARDTRFSADKTPYKTYLDIIFDHGAAGGMRNGPGFFFRLSPQELIVGVGIYVFDKPLLKRYREAVAADDMGTALVEALEEIRKRGGRNYGFTDPHYKRVPPGYDAEHPRAELLRMNGMHAWRKSKPPRSLGKAAFLDEVYGVYETLFPLTRWLDRLVAS